jgi:hypothetical protein
MAILEAPNTLRDAPIPAKWMAGSSVAGDINPFGGGDVIGYLGSQGIWMWARGPFSGLALLGHDGVVRQLTAGPEIFQIAGGCN